MSPVFPIIITFRVSLSKYAVTLLVSIETSSKTAIIRILFRILCPTHKKPPKADRKVQRLLSGVVLFVSSGQEAHTLSYTIVAHL